MEGKRLNEIKGFENISMYVKFLKRGYLEDLLNGSIYMKNFNFFIELEKKAKEKGQGDKLEIAHVVRSNKIKLIDPETKMVLATASVGEMVERYTGMEKMPVFCVTHFHSSDFMVTNIKDGIVTAKIDIPIEDQEMFEQTFGDTAVILTNEFTEKMIKASKESNLGIAIGNVQYQDYNFYSSERKKLFDEQAIDLLFWKDDFFINQREARFILTQVAVEDHYRLEIGEIRGNSKVTSTKELLTDSEFEFALNEE
ncbi:hypothetical protein [Cytobacillus firmus]|uniref:hypothetical protein n=1 Tax=Cytobacillus firmus TaxID=1399 RepID=UPI001C8E376B|nr:hypothetical protein [Cytobacillus firmus]MBX9972531.1 hypothetical protein [Cytobacillus firmus]